MKTVQNNKPATIQDRFTVRPNSGLSEWIKHSYEQVRTIHLQSGQSIPSMNEYLCSVIFDGLNLNHERAVREIENL